MMILIFIAGMFTGTLFTALCAASKSNEVMDPMQEKSDNKILEEEAV